MQWAISRSDSDAVIELYRNILIQWDIRSSDGEAVIQICRVLTQWGLEMMQWYSEQVWQWCGDTNDVRMQSDLCSSASSTGAQRDTVTTVNNAGVQWYIESFAGQTVIHCELSRSNWCNYTVGSDAGCSDTDISGLIVMQRDFYKSNNEVIWWEAIWWEIVRSETTSLVFFPSVSLIFLGNCLVIGNTLVFGCLRCLVLHFNHPGPLLVCCSRNQGSHVVYWRK